MLDGPGIPEMNNPCSGWEMVHALNTNQDSPVASGCPQFYSIVKLTSRRNDEYLLWEFWWKNYPY